MQNEKLVEKTSGLLLDALAMYSRALISKDYKLVVLEVTEVGQGMTKLLFALKNSDYKDIEKDIKKLETSMATLKTRWGKNI